MGCHPVSAIDNTGYRSCKLDGCDLKGLTKGYCCQFHSLHILFLMHNCSRLTGKIDPRFLQQSKPGKIFIIVIHSQPQSHGDKNRITAVHGCLHKILGSMPGYFMTPDSSVLHHDISGTVKLVIYRNHSLLKSRSSRDDLEGGTRLISIINAPVSPNSVQYLLGLLLCHISCIHGFRKFIGIVQVKLRHIHHCHDFTILGIHHNNGDSVCFLCFHHLLCQLGSIALNVHVEADIQIISGNRLYSLLSGFIDLHTLCIRHCKDRALLPLKIFFVLHLKTYNSLIVTAGKTKHLGCKTSVRIISLIVFIHLDSRKIVCSYGISRFLVHIALDSLYGRIFFHSLSHIFFRKLKLSAKDLHDFVRLFDLAVDHRNSADRLIVGDDGTVCINNPASCRLDASLPFMKFLCLFRIIC